MKDSEIMNNGNIMNELEETRIKTLEHHQQLTLNNKDSRPSPLRCFLNALKRKKPLDCRTETDLHRCLSFLDLTALGIGSTLGLGLYVLVGQVASNKAGPAVVISFALAALGSAFSAVCYAEFAGLVPRAGSAYAYSYIMVGEFVAFVIGWNLILEYVIGAASVARGFSSYARFLCTEVIWNYLKGIPTELLTHADNSSQLPLIETLTQPSTSPIPEAMDSAKPSGLTLVATTGNVTGATQTSQGINPLESIYSYLLFYFDWVSIAIVGIVTLFFLRGVKGSTNVTLAFTGLNLLVVSTVVISSLSHLDVHNWQLTKSEVPPGCGEGGFVPYGWSGVLTGSATCFFGFIGFDTIAASAEEAKNPKRDVPLSILLSLFISTIVYMTVAIVQTLIWPYYSQNRVVILPYIFDQLHMPFTYWTILLGAISGLASSQLAGMYPLPRIIYSIASDRLIFSPLAHINQRFKLPLKATIVGSLAVALLASTLDIESLADMVSIGTLAAYSLVSLSVLILRYEHQKDTLTDSNAQTNHLTVVDLLGTLSAANQQNSNLTFSNSQKPTNSFEKQKSTNEDAQHEGKTNHAKLRSKPSIPIREKGSRALAPQLSVGFQSWFKSYPKNLEDESTGNINVTKNSSSERQLNYFELIRKRKCSAQPPDEHSSHQSKVLISIIIILSILFDIALMQLIYNKYGELPANFGINQTIHAKTLLTSIVSIISISLLVVIFMLSRLPVRLRNSSNNYFQVPCVPVVPTISILVNTFLMLNLSILTWLRFTVWMAIGLVIYFSYGIWKSKGHLTHVVS